MKFNFAKPCTGGENEEEVWSPAFARGSSESSAVAVRAAFLKSRFFQINTTFNHFEEISPLKGVQRKGRVLALQGGELGKLGKEPFSPCSAERSLQMKTNWDRWEANSIYRTNSPWMLITSLVSGESHGSAGWKWNDCMTSEPTAVPTNAVGGGGLAWMVVVGGKCGDKGSPLESENWIFTF